jgi:hypothetical protein
MMAGPCSTWPQLDILLAVAAASLLCIEPLPTPKSNLSYYRLNCIRREQKNYLPSYLYMLNSRAPSMLQQVKAQDYMNGDLISVGKSMTFYLSCNFTSGLMSLCSPVDAFQPQGPRMNSQKSSPKLL